jgi:hypothetical protein
MRFHWIIHDHVIHELYCHLNEIILSLIINLIFLGRSNPGTCFVGSSIKFLLKISTSCQTAFQINIILLLLLLLYYRNNN